MHLAGGSGIGAGANYRALDIAPAVTGLWALVSRLDLAAELWGCLLPQQHRLNLGWCERRVLEVDSAWQFAQTGNRSLAGSIWYACLIEDRGTR